MAQWICNVQGTLCTYDDVKERWASADPTLVEALEAIGMPDRYDIILFDLPEPLGDAALIVYHAMARLFGEVTAVPSTVTNYEADHVR